MVAKISETVRDLGKEMGQTMSIKPQKEAKIIWSAILAKDLREQLQKIFYDSAESARKEVLKSREGETK